MDILAHTFYTKRQLDKMHRQFLRPSETKLYGLLETAGKEAVVPDMLRMLE